MLVSSLSFNKITGLLGAAALACCAIGCSSEVDKGSDSDASSSQKNEKGEGDEGANSDIKGVDANQIIALDAPKERVKKCKELATKIYEKLGVDEDQEEVECGEEGGVSDTMEIFKVDETCENLFDPKKPLHCAMTYDQLNWCFEAAPECSMAKQMICGLRVEVECDPEIAPKKKPSDQKLRQDAVPLADLSSELLQTECVRRLEAEHKELGVEPGDTYECESSKTKVEVREPEEECSEVANAIDFDLDLCDLRLGELSTCLSVRSRCDSDIDHMCGFLIAGCVEDPDDEEG